MRDPTQWLADHWRQQAAAGAPPDRGRYPHSAECRQTDRDPAWEVVDPNGPMWRRGPCGGHATCTLIQHGENRPPAPPRPDDDELAIFEVEHGRAHVEVALEVARGDRLPHWRARCSACGATRSWWSVAAAHYEGHGARIGAPRSAVLTMMEGDRASAHDR